MKYRLPCEVVCDLLPSYIEELTNETSTEAIKEHLQTCESCRGKYDKMSGKEPMPSPEENAEIDFLKKNRKKGRRKTVCAVIATILVILLVAGYRNYIAGTICDPQLLKYELYVDEDMVTFSVRSLEEDKGIRVVGYTFEDGKLNIEVKSTGASFIYNNECESSYTPEGKIREITVNDTMIVWYEGEYISPKVSEIFIKKHQYIGDMSANGELAEAVGMSGIIGPYKNELLTDKEPYGWRMIAESDFTKAEAEVLRERFAPYAAILIATVDNLDYVECVYRCNDETKRIKVTAEDANKLIEQSFEKDIQINIKEYASTAGGLQRITEKLPIYDFSFSNGNPGRYYGGDLSIHLNNGADCDIYGMAVTYYINGDSRSSTGTSAADGGALEKGPVGNMAVPAENEVGDLDKDILSVGVSVSDKNGNTYDITPVELGSIREMRKNFSGNYVKESGLFKFECTVHGSFDKGFTIEFK